MGSRLASIAAVCVNAARTVRRRVAAAVGLILVPLLLSLVESSEARRTRLEVEAMNAARAPPSAADEFCVYVRRAELEDTIESFLREPITDAGSYMVVVGQRGAGKSTLVSHVLSKMGKGILVVKIDDESITTSDLKALVLRTALQKYEPLKTSLFATSTPLEGADLAERLEAAANARGEEGWRPTLVLEITRPDGSARSACNLLKQITHDQPLCHGILVLSSSFQVANMPDDRGRQRFLRVGAFSPDGASAYLDANFQAHLPVEVATSTAVAAVKERILPLTTVPKDVGAFASAVLGSKSEEEFRARAEAWANEFEARARMAVECAAQVNVFNTVLGAGESPLFTSRDLMRELLDTGAPVELPSATFSIPSDMFASKICESREAMAVFNLDLVSMTVDFVSAAHRKAAAELLPSPPPTS
jgi:energy-coupling factor transporter ATP-binding protein EcfA2